MDPISELPIELRTPSRANPYGPRPGQPPAYLAGREPHTTAADARFQSLVQTGRSPACLMFTGPRGMGKTSLLRELSSQAQRSKLVTAWVTATSQTSLGMQIVATVRHEFESKTDSVIEEVLNKIETLKFSLGVPGMGVELATNPGARKDVEFSVALADLATAVRDGGSQGVVIFIDELQNAAPGDLELLLPCIQDYTSSASAIPILFVGAGLTTLPGVLARQAGFAERFDYRWVERLDPIATGLAFGAGLSDDVEWLSGAMEAGVEGSAGHPYLIQLIGHYAWETSGNATSRKPGFLESDIRVGIELARSELRQILASRWESATQAHRAALKSVAGAGGASLSRQQLIEALDIPTAEAELAIQNLYDDGWLEIDGLEDVRIAYPGLEQFILLRTS